MKKTKFGLLALAIIASVGTTYAFLSFGKLLEENDYFDEGIDEE